MRYLILLFVSCLGAAEPLAAAGQPAAPPAAAVSPGAPRLLPEETLAYLRVENVDALRSDLQASSIGQMFDDPKLRPFAGDLFVTASELFAQLSGELGLTLEELLAIPRGQLAIALIAIGSDQPAGTPAGEALDESPAAIRQRLEARRQQQSALGGVIVVDTGEDNAALVQLLEELEARLRRGGSVARDQTVGGTPVRRLVRPDGRARMEYFHRGGTTVIGFGPGAALDVLARWDGTAAGRTLAESTDFAAVMSRCLGAAETRPQVTFFVDPYRLLRRAASRGGAGAAVAWTIFEELGISKIRGVGGSTFHGGEFFADIAHAHVLIDPPRDGIFSVLRPATGDTNPPRWVPDDVTTYTSIGWRVEAAYDGLGRILDRFQGDGALQRLVETPYQRRVGGDFRQAIIRAMDDRLVMTSWLQPPVTVNSSVSINAVKLKDAAAAARTIAQLQEAFPTFIREESLGATRLYRLGSGRGRQVPQGFRQPEPCAAIVGDWLLTSDSQEFIERAIRADGGALPRLGELPDYDLVASELGAQLGGEKPFLLSFARSAEILRQVYELAKSDQARGFLQTRGEQNPMLRRVAEMLQRNELPPFDEFRKYFAPSGSFAYDEPSGIHFGTYTLKP